MTKRFGFTLAEVLITLGIIGVVAAMTIPTLMNQTGAAEFRTGFKKAISVLNQAITMNVALESSDFSVLKGSDGAGSIVSMFDARTISTNTTDGSGIINSTAGLSPAVAAGNYNVYLQDGMVVSFATTTGDTACTEANPCEALVDVNGDKRPNRYSTYDAGTDTVTIGDQFGVLFFDQQVIPGDEAARRVMFQ